MSRPHVVVVGGGVTGMATAYTARKVAREAGAGLRITLIERDARLGGKVGTEVVDGCLVDTGPDAFLGQKPWALQLVRELGMEDEVIRPLQRRFYMLIDGGLHEVPHELVSLVPTRPEALWKASFLSVAAKARASAEGLQPPLRGQDDESLASFMRRRFGSEFSQRFAEPLMGGVHAGNPDRMSMAGIYPMYWKMEQELGSVTKGILGMRARSVLKPNAPPQSPFVALRGGMQRLIDRLEQALEGVEVRTRRSVDALEPCGGGVRVRLDDGDELTADAAVVTLPAFGAAELVAPFAPGAADLLRAIPYASTAVASLAYRRSDIGDPLEGTGFLAPRPDPASREPEAAITGCTWSSNKWEGRAPEGIALMRAFMGYADHDADVREKSEGELAQAAHGALAGLLRIGAAPVSARVYRWLRAMPQYEVGHLGRIARIEEELSATPGIVTAGSAYRGVGIPDCVRQGQEAARTALAAAGIGTKE